MAAELISEARRLAAGQGYLPADAVSSLVDSSGLDLATVMLQLLPIAGELASPPISRLHVGAIGQGESQALYFGANLELAGGPLGDTVHAEQAVVVNALAHGERGLPRLAVSAAPCGHCRQFLWELSPDGDPEIHVLGTDAELLSALLPRPFGPADLGNSAPLLRHAPTLLNFAASHSDAVTTAAAVSAAVSYAPYSQAVAGVGLATCDGTVVGGSYVENVAFNPSLSPLLAALAMLMLRAKSLADVSQAVLVRRHDSAIDHDGWAARLLAKVAPRVQLQIVAALPS